MTKRIGIIGTGIVGATAAYYLSKENVKLTIFDEGVGQATSAAAGIISPWLSQRRNQEWYFLAREGAKFYQTLIQDLNQQASTKEIYQQTGTILYKKNEQLLAKLKKLAEARKIEAPEIGEINQLSFSDIKALIPNMTMEDDALFITGGAKVDGAGLIQLLLSLVEKQNQLLIKKKVQSISFKKTHWEINDGSSIYEFDQLILSSGAWIGELLTPLNFDVDVRPQKGQLIELETTLTSSQWPVVMPVGETDIIPFDNGKILVGATHENEEGFDLTPNEALLSKLKKEATEFIPELEQVNIKKVRVGTRAYTSDFSPFFGEITNLPKLLVASGLGSSGLTTGPIIGKTLADWTLNKATAFEAYRQKPNQYIIPKA